MHAALDLFLERWRARFAAEEPDTQARILPIETVFLAIFAHVHRIGRRGDEHGGLVVVDHHEMTFGIARPCRDNHAAQMLKTIVQPETTSEHAIAKRHLNTVRRHHTCHLSQAGDAITPDIQIVIVVSHHDRLSRGA